MQAGAGMGGFVSYMEKINGQKLPGKSEKFFDHFSQAALFLHSLTDWEQAHMVKAFQFELGRKETSGALSPVVFCLTPDQH